MEIQRLVTEAQLGNDEAFAALVKLYQRRLLALVRSVVKQELQAEDLVQEAFLRAWSSLAALKTPEAFPAWLGSIARNLALSHCRARRRSEGLEAQVLDDFADPRSEAPEPDVPGWGELAAGLTKAQRQLVGLRHGAGLSLRQIGLVLGIPEQRVKSRLFTLRRSLTKARGRLVLTYPPVLLEEKIMTKIETLQLGAHVFERLSLAAQTTFARAVIAGQSLPETVLADLGRIDRGSEFLELYGPRFGLAEMVNFLNYVDRFTECRLVEHLETLAPAEAEILKQNFFVFEDILCFDAAALGLLHATADRDLLVISLAGTELRVRHHFLDALSPEDRADLQARLGYADGDRKVVRAAQEFVVHTIRELEQAGRLVFVPREGRVGEALFTAV